MNLDNEIMLIQNTVCKDKSLDFFDQSFWEFSELYSKILDESKRIAKLPMQGFNVPFYEQDGVQNISYAKLKKLEGIEFVDAVYQAILRRKPDMQGLNYYLGKLENKQMSKFEMVYEIGLSEEAAYKDFIVVDCDKKVMKASNILKYDGQRFIQLAYRWVLGREADKEGMRSNLEALQNGFTYKEIILHSLVKSEEAQNCQIKIKGLYKAYMIKKLKLKMKKIPLFRKLNTLRKRVLK